MSSKQSFLEGVLLYSFGTPAFDRGAWTDVSINLFAETKSSFSIVCTAKLFGAGISYYSALHRTFHGHALSSTSKADFVVIESAEVEDKFSLTSLSLSRLKGKRRKVQSTLGNMHPSGYYASHTLAIISRSPFHTFCKDVPPSVDMKGVVTKTARLLNGGASETLTTAVRVIKFDVVHYCHEDLLFGVNQISDAKIQLRDASDGHVVFLL